MNIEELKKEQIRKHGPNSFNCKCGKPKQIIKNKAAKLGYVYFYSCGAVECCSRYGIKRPKHSEHMKKLVATNPEYSNNLFKPGVVANKEVNTVAFYKKKLTNLGYDISNLDDTEVLLLERHVKSKLHNQRSTKVKTLLTFVKKNKLEHHFKELDQTKLLNMSEEDFKKILYKKNSLNYFLYCFDKVGNKKYKKIEKTDLRYNKRGITNLIVRSSYESNYIDFFERNAISWDYESIRLQLELTSYTPDFIVTLNGVDYILEVKGFLAESTKEEYLKTKINAAIQYTKTNNMKFLFSFKSTVHSIDELLSTEITEEF